MIGLIATAGGNQAAVNPVNAMIHVVHAVRGIALPFFVVIPRSWRVFGRNGNVTDETWEKRLDQIGRLVVLTTAHFSMPNLPAAND